MSWLQNSWMDNPTFLAEMAHFAWAYGILLTAALWSATRRQLALLFLAFVVFAVVKEFWYDLRYEIPTDTVAGSTLDFCVYLAGGIVALGVVWVRRRVESSQSLGQEVFIDCANPSERATDRGYNPTPFKPRVYQPGEDN